MRDPLQRTLPLGFLITIFEFRIANSESGIPNRELRYLRTKNSAPSEGILHESMRIKNKELRARRHRKEQVIKEAIRVAKAEKAAQTKAAPKRAAKPKAS